MLLDLTVCKFLGCLVGVFLRTYLPARRKKRDALAAGKPWKWRDMYVNTALVSLFVAVVTALFLLPSVAVQGTEALIVFGGSMAVGFGSNGISNEIYDMVKNRDEEPKVEDPPGT